MTDDVIYLAMALRNVGTGIAVLDRWWLSSERLLANAPHDDPENFRRLTRDLYVPPSDRGFWQGALREASDPLFGSMRDAILARRPFTIDLLYGDFEGGQRMITRFGIAPSSSGEHWIASSAVNWNLDRPEPR